MKLAISAAFKAFCDQFKENTFELAKKTCEKRGYEVRKPQPKKATTK